MLDLSGKVALVTGASRGIGAAIARTLAAQGATVIAAARGSNAGANVAEIVAKGGTAEAASLDVTDPAAVEVVVNGALARHGRLDILVNNAGITRDQLMMRMKRDDWDAVIATNLTACVQLHAGRAASDDQTAKRPHHRHQLGGRTDGQRRAGELRRVEGGTDRDGEVSRARSGLARDHRQRRGARA